jgi:hypothetical protein
MTEDNRKLYRQIHPTWVQDDRPWSKAFSPTPKDNGYLSVYNSEVFTPKEAYEHYTQRGLKSAFVVSLTVQNCTGLKLKVIDDNIPFHGHSSIDFNFIETNNQRDKIAGQLKKKAIIEYKPN